MMDIPRRNNIVKPIKRYLIFKIIFIGFCVWFLTCILYLHFFDRYESSSDDKENHSMIKGDPGKYWLNALNITQQVQAGVNPLLAGMHHRIPFLYPRLLAIYGFIGGVRFFEEDGRVSLGGKIGFLLFQGLFYYVSLFLFFVKLSQVLPKRIAIISTGFLAFEPTVLQYHSSFWSESIYLSLELIVLSLFIMPSRKMIPNVMVGIIVGLMFLQRSIAVLYVLVLITLLIVQFRRKALAPVLFLILGYLPIIGFLGLHNYYRAGFFYVTPTQAIDGPLNYLANYVIADVEGSSPRETRSQLISRSKEIAYEKGIYRDKDRLTERDAYNFYLIQRDMAIDIFKNHPIITLKYISYNMMRTLIISPAAIYWYNTFEYKPKSKVVQGEQLRQQKYIFRPIRWSYTVIILGIVGTGFILSLKRMNTSINLFLFLSILYLWVVVGWFGNSRYMLPALVFYSIYIGMAIDWFLEKIKSKKMNTA